MIKEQVCKIVLAHTDDLHFGKHASLAVCLPVKHLF